MGYRGIQRPDTVRLFDERKGDQGRRRTRLRRPGCSFPVL